MFFFLLAVVFPTRFLCIRRNNYAKSCIQVKKISGVSTYHLKYLVNMRKRLGMNVMWRCININYGL